MDLIVGHAFYGLLRSFSLAYLKTCINRRVTLSKIYFEIFEFQVGTFQRDYRLVVCCNCCWNKVKFMSYLGQIICTDKELELHVWMSNFEARGKVCVEEPQSQDYLTVGDSPREGNWLGIWPLETTHSPLLQCKTRPHFSEFFGAGPPTLIYQPIRSMRISRQFGGTLRLSQTHD